MKFLRFLILLFCFLLPMVFYTGHIDSPFEFFKYIFSGVAISAIGILFSTYVLQRKIKTFRISNVLLLLLCITGCNLISYFFSDNQYLAFWGDNLLPSDSLASVLLFVAFAFIVEQTFAEYSKRIGIALIAALTVQALYGLAQACGYDFFTWNYFNSVFGSFGSTVSFASFLGCLLPVFVDLWAALRTTGRYRSSGKWVRVRRRSVLSRRRAGTA